MSNDYTDSCDRCKETLGCDELRCFDYGDLWFCNDCYQFMNLILENPDAVWYMAR